MTSLRHIAFLHTFSNSVEMQSSKCELKLEMDANSYHFEAGYIKQVFFLFQNDAVNVTNK